MKQKVSSKSGADSDDRTSFLFSQRVIIFLISRNKWERGLRAQLSRKIIYAHTAEVY